ncbi:pro-FMRFamide-related neuropeptide FF isoform X2 [Mastomys coucha]|uniref:pro-FMRFamide-related neuropeptide FF isoform X2 n=1 Tax=Mastomys coucha TaxID=35658 RepID=UPI0012614D72|nr:pro-FMRFamide-related neuropeptide FF isoform X2 [Mastomys coucha]
MDSKWAAVLLLLLLLLNWGHTEAGSWGEDQVFADEDKGPHLPRYAHTPDRIQTPGSLLRVVLQAIERPRRSPALLFQPQRFGRNAWGSWSKEHLSPQAREFWSLAAPQRFGKK